MEWVAECIKLQSVMLNLFQHLTVHKQILKQVQDDNKMTPLTKGVLCCKIQRLRVELTTYDPINYHIFFIISSGVGNVSNGRHADWRNSSGFAGGGVGV